MTALTFEARAVAAYFSLNLEIYDDKRGSGLLTFRLLSLTPLLFWLGYFWAAAGRVWLSFDRRLAHAAARYRHLHVYWLLAGIGLRALCWGVRP